MTLEDTIEKISDSLISEKNFFEHKNILFVGENTTGKSRAIAKLVEKMFAKNQPIYYICSWNRKIVNKREELKKTFKDISPNDIVATRLSEEYFNRDIFKSELGIELVMNELYNNSKKYTALFKDFLNLNVSAISKPEGLLSEDILEVNGENFERLSDAQVSMMRILMEVNFAYENSCKVVFIDEFDINLDHINSSGFMEWLKEKYPEMAFVISAHSLYTILNLNDFDIIKISKTYRRMESNLCTFFDSNDLDNVEIIDKKLFGNVYCLNELDELLGSILKCLLSNNTVNIEDIKNIEDKEKLTTRQRVIFNFIKKRMDEE